MRHQKNRLLELETGAKKKSVYIRVLLSNLLKNGKLTTTWKRAKVIKAEADHFFSKLLEISKRNKVETDAKREIVRYVKSVVYGEDTGKRVVEVLFPKYVKEGTVGGFVASYDLGFRFGDSAPKIMLKLL